MPRILDPMGRLVSGRFTTLNVGVLAVSAACVAVLGCAVVWPVLRPAAILAGVGYLVALLTLCSLVLLRMFDRLDRRLQDVLCAHSLEVNFTRLGYRPADFFMDGWAAAPSLQLFLLKCLRLAKPRRILEIGSGQTTKVLSCYRQETPDARILTLEEDAKWKALMEPQLADTNGSHVYLHRPLEDRSFTCSGSGEAIRTKWYRDVPELDREKFELILVDGPNGSDRYSRAGILEHVPQILDDSFVVIFDDARRRGEQMTISALEKILHANDRKFIRFDVGGTSRQTVICSPDRAYLQSC